MKFLDMDESLVTKLHSINERIFSIMCAMINNLGCISVVECSLCMRKVLGSKPSISN